MKCIKAIVFDWGDTLMRDIPGYEGPMCKWPTVEVLDTVQETLEKLQDNYKCCVASNASDSNAELMASALERVDIKKYFKYLVTSKELGYSKPEINFYLEIIKRINVKPNECLMVGNDYLKDIIPAKKAGMNTAFLDSNNSDDPKEYADYIINYIGDLMKIV